MCIYSVVNVENMKLFELSMLDREPDKVLPSIEDLALETWEELVEYTVLQKKSKRTKQGYYEIWKVGLKGKLLGKAKWYSKGKIEVNFPHLICKKLLGAKILPKCGGMIQNESI